MFVIMFSLEADGQLWMLPQLQEVRKCVALVTACLPFVVALQCHTNLTLT